MEGKEGLNEPIEVEDKEDVSSMNSEEYNAGSEIDTELGTDDEDDYNKGIGKFESLHDANRTENSLKHLSYHYSCHKAGMQEIDKEYIEKSFMKLVKILLTLETSSID